jgi:hypothetical protein
MRHVRQSALFVCQALERRMLMSLLPLGGEFRANTTLDQSQSSPAVASDADGDSVVVWHGNGVGDALGIFGRRYNSAGTAQGSEFLLNTTTSGTQNLPAVAMNPSGDFVVAWAGNGPGDTGGIFVQRFNAAGTAQGGELRVNTFTTGIQRYPTVAMDPLGNFVVAWGSIGQDGSGEGIYARRVTASGLPVGSEFLVNTTTAGNQEFTKLAMDADGNFAVVWQGGGTGDTGGIFAQRYNAAAAPQGGEFRVNTFTTNAQAVASIAVHPSGNFVVTWSSDQDQAGVSNFGIYAQRFDAAGTAQGSEFRVNTTTASIQLSNSVAIDADGNFLVAWSSQDQDGSLAGIYRQSFSGDGVAQGDELRVNTYTTNNQDVPAVAMDADGDAVIVWQSELQDGSSHGVYAQRYGNFPGTPFSAGGEFRVNTFTTGGQGDAAIASDADGDFVVVWTSAQDGSSNSVHGRRFSSNGVPQGDEFLVNSTTDNIQFRPEVAMDAIGNFVVVWSGNGVGDGFGVFARRYDAAGVAQGPEFKVNSHTTDRQDNPSVAMDAAGDFLVAWESDIQDGFGYGIYAQRFNAAGAAQGSEFRVNTFTPQSQTRPTTAMDIDGDFVVGWISLGQDGEFEGIYAQRYDATGVPQGGEFRVNTTTVGRQNRPSVGMDADGDFVVAWDSPTGPGDSNTGVFAQRYSAAGQPRGHEFRVNTFTTDVQSTPSVAMSADGDFVVAWHSERQVSSSFYDVYCQRFNAAGQPLGIELRVNTTTSFDQASPAAAIPANQRMVIAWASNQVFNDPSDVYAQRYTLPATAPEVVESSFVPEPLPHKVRFGFSQDVSASLSVGDVLFENLTTSQTIPAGDLSLSYDSPSNTANITYTGSAGGASGVLAAGDYRITLGASGITNAAGTAMDEDHVFTFALPVVVPLGGEFRVNIAILSEQIEPAIARDADGDFVVAWASNNQDGDVLGIYAQRFDERGVKLGSEFRVNTSTTDNQMAPAVAMDAAGNFVVTWQSRQDGLSHDVYAQRYNAAGVAQGGEFRVNTFTTSSQMSPSIAMDSDSDFVIAWNGSTALDGDGVFAQRFNAAGEPQGGEFLVNTFTTGPQEEVSIAMDSDGDFVVAWQSTGQESSLNTGVYARRFDASGAAQGGEFHVNTFTPLIQGRPSAAMESDGDFIIAWNSQNQDGAVYEIYAQRYNAAGVTQGTEFRVNTTVDDSQANPSVAVSPSGSFLLTWQGRGAGGIGIIGKRFSASGVAIGDEFLLSTFPSGIQANSAAVLNADGSVVATWDSSVQDPDASEGVYARRIGVPIPPAVTSSSFPFESAPHRVQFIFSDNVSASLGTNDLVLENLTTAQTIPADQLTLLYDGQTNTATFRFTGPVINILPDGNYRATLIASGIINPDGTAMAANHVFNFFVLAGDANRDRSVDVADLGILASNWQQSPRTFSQGNFDYSANGLVDVADLGILASHWQQSLPVAASSRVGPPRTPTRTIRLIDTLS